MQPPTAQPPGMERNRSHSPDRVGRGGGADEGGQRRALGPALQAIIEYLVGFGGRGCLGAGRSEFAGRRWEGGVFVDRGERR
jgi:hypothetical protein